MSIHVAGLSVNRCEEMILRLIVYRERPEIIVRAGVSWPEPETEQAELVSVGKV
jgi:hypothetical protein